MRVLHILPLLFFLIAGCRTKEVAQVPTVDTAQYKEKHRPQIHFSPPAKWMNDPNGMVFHNDEYHLFYQYFPDSTVWGPMHWGHAVSKDLVHWTNLPVALYPDSLGLIFSGSAVVDKNNTSGFGTAANPPMVAIYTYHSEEKEKAGRTDYQYQGIAYSTDNGRKWTKYQENPVLKNQGIKDFRDPKVFWHKETKKWIMILAVSDHIELWSSNDLKRWSKLSDFGHQHGGHGGVWECPDLFKLKVEGSEKEKWVMLVSINPGGPNGGSATQYFTGDFDGKTFRADYAPGVTRWIDHGPDNYAGVTWSNVPNNRLIFLGWMSNWAYGQEVPTEKWRSANTAPRDLALASVNDTLHLRSTISPEFLKNAKSPIVIDAQPVQDSLDLSSKAGDVSISVISATVDAKDFTIELSNAMGQRLSIGFDNVKNTFIIDRTASGKNIFSSNFFPRSSARRISNKPKINVQIIVDVSSVEVFFDDGLTVMTSLYFPDEKLSRLAFKGSNRIENLQILPMSSIW